MIEKLKRIKQSIGNARKMTLDYDLDDDYIELKEQNTHTESNIMLRYCVIDSFEDVKPILDFLREGNSICVIKIKDLRDKDINELKRGISKIKKVCEVMDGEVVGMDEDYLIASPSFVKISKDMGKK